MMADGGESSAAEVLQAFEGSAEMLQAKTWGLVPAWAMKSINYHLLALLGGEEYLQSWTKAGADLRYSAPWFVAGVHVAGQVASFIDQRLPYGTRILSAVNTTIVN